MATKEDPAGEEEAQASACHIVLALGQSVSHDRGFPKLPFH